MVSLKSFKLINEGERDEVEEPSSNQLANGHNTMPRSIQPLAARINANENTNISNLTTSSNPDTNINMSTQISLPVEELVAEQSANISRAEYITYNEANIPTSDSRTLSVVTEGEHFEIVWSNLSYKIEPKWYKKINFLDQMFQTIDGHSSASSTASSSAGMNDNQHQMHATAQAEAIRPKTSLDPIEIFTNLNGTIKSGQMTAILGPSGKIN